jgi:hypothetical protein
MNYKNQYFSMFSIFSIFSINSPQIMRIFTDKEKKGKRGQKWCKNGTCLKKYFILISVNLRPSADFLARVFSPIRG